MNCAPSPLHLHSHVLQAWQTSMSLLHICGHLLEQVAPKTSQSAAVCDVVAAVVTRYAKTPLVMKTVLQVRCSAVCLCAHGCCVCQWRMCVCLTCSAQTLSNCVLDHEALLEPFKLASVSLSARELVAVVHNPQRQHRFHFMNRFHVLNCPCVAGAARRAGLQRWRGSRRCRQR